MACALEMEARYSLNCLPDSRVGTSTRFRWKSFPRESSRSATARQAGLSQDRKSRFMAGKQDSPERGKGGDYGRIIPCRGVFSHLFFQGCREGDGRSRSVRGFSGVLALREGCLFLYPRIFAWEGRLPVFGRELFRPFVEGNFSLAVFRPASVGTGRTFFPEGSSPSGFFGNAPPP